MFENNYGLTLYTRPIHWFGQGGVVEFNFGRVEE